MLRNGERFLRNRMSRLMSSGMLAGGKWATLIALLSACRMLSYD